MSWKSAVLLLPAIVLLSAADPAGSPTLRPHYRANDTVVYDMHGINADRAHTTHYEAFGRAAVMQDPSGTFFEDVTWTGMNIEGVPLALTPGTVAFRQRLSLAPDAKVGIPPLNVVQPNFIGPITDLLTFYVDVSLAMRMSALVHAGDHVYFPLGVPSSWADGTYTLIGQSAVDFDITLASIDSTTQIATLVVRHVPPSVSKVKLPADWMQPPVGKLPNNWVEVEKTSGGKYAAEVGQETYEDTIRYSLTSGRIVGATMDNPVDVFARDCDDAALTVCGAPMRYRIRRQITLDAV
jgi:hypothetical protein